MGSLMVTAKMANGSMVARAGEAKQMRAEPVDIVACVFHELRTPITALLSSGENIRDGLVDGRSLREEGLHIIEQAMRLMNLGDQILLYASAKKGGPRHDLRSLTASEVIENAVNNTVVLFKQGQVALEREVQPGLPFVQGDLFLLSQCVQNLISNAVKYGAETNWVGISALLGESRGVGKEIRIGVHDRGRGINEEDLPHIFEPFFRGRCAVASRIPGSGLGLSIAKRYAEACGGTLSVVSEKDLGSVFTLHLPLNHEFARQ